VGTAAPLNEVIYKVGWKSICLVGQGDNSQFLEGE
jgi:hypothetical protein